MHWPAFNVMAHAEAAFLWDWIAPLLLESFGCSEFV